MGKPRINHVLPEEKLIVDELCRLREQLGYTDAHFHRDFLPHSSTIWTRVRHDKYTGDTRKVMADYSHALERCKQTLAEATAAEPQLADESFYVNRDSEAVLAALKLAGKRQDEKRIVIYLATQGGSKSAVCRHLKRTQAAMITHATEAWTRSYCAGLQAVGRAAGLKETFKSTRNLEDAVFRSLRARGRDILAIDEANTFGPHTCNMIRDICNHTMITVFIAGLPAFFDQLKKKSFWQSAQMIRRAIAIIEAGDLGASDVAPFLEGLNFNGAADDARAEIARAANLTNRFDMIKCVADNLRLRHGKKDEITMDQVTRAIEIERGKLRMRDELTGRSRRK